MGFPRSGPQWINYSGALNVRLSPRSPSSYNMVHILPRFDHKSNSNRIMSVFLSEKSSFRKRNASSSTPEKSYNRPASRDRKDEAEVTPGKKGRADYDERDGWRSRAEETSAPSLDIDIRNSLILPA